MTDDRSLSALIKWARGQLTGTSDTPSLDAQLLMMRTLGRPRAWLLAHPEHPLPEDKKLTFEQFVSRCQAGEALPYVLGWWEFFGRQFHLTPDVLIPRPESEHLVETALTTLANRMEPARVLDLGTGSGCILISLALEQSENQYWGSDISSAALKVAHKNLEEYRLQAEVRLVQADLLRPFQGPFDLIVANLPYIRRDHLNELAVAKKEPFLALNGGTDGLDQVRRFVHELPRVLAAKGDLVLELDPEQMETAHALLRESLRWEDVRIKDDLAGNARVLWAVGAIRESEGL